MIDPSGSDPNPTVRRSPERGRARSKARAETPAFGVFYDRYPRKKKRPQAFAAWVGKDCEQVADEVMAGLERALPELQRRPPDRVPYPASWLNGLEWKDPPLALIPAAPRVPEKFADSRALALDWAHKTEVSR